MNKKQIGLSIAFGGFLLALGILFSLPSFDVSAEIYRQALPYDDPLMMFANQARWEGILEVFFAAFVLVPMYQFGVLWRIKRDPRKSWFLVLSALGLLGSVFLTIRSMQYDPWRIDSIGVLILGIVLALGIQGLFAFVVLTQDRP